MDIINIYNPNNSAITDKEISEMRNLTIEQINQLAKAYPNQPTGNAYLVYYDKNLPEKEQRYPLGTWANLANLYKIGQSHILPFSFRKKFANRVIDKTPSPQRTVDLSKEDLSKAEGLKDPGENTNHLPLEGENTDSPELAELKSHLEQLKKDHAHHMTIKAVQKQIDELTK